MLATLRVGNVRAADPAAARLRREPGRDLPRPRPAAVAPLPGRLPLAGAPQRGGFGADAVVHLGKHGIAGVAARQGRRRCPPPAPPTPRSATCRWSTRSSSTTPARARRPSAARTPRSSTTSCRRWPAPRPTATSPGSSSCSTSTPTSRRMDPAKLPAIRGADLDADPGRASWTTTSGSTSARTTTTSTTSSCTSTAGSARSRTSRSATACTSSARRRHGEARVNLVLAILRAAQVWGGAGAARCPACATALGLEEARSDGDHAPPWTAVEAQPPRAARSRRMEAAGWGPDRAATAVVEDVLGARPTRRSRRCSHFAATEVVPRLARTTDEIDARAARARRRLRPGRPVRVAAARPGQRAADRPQLLLRRPEGDPVAGWPGRPGQAMADSLVAALPRRDRRATRASVGLSVWGTSRDAHRRRRHRRGARAARRAAGLGRGVPPGRPASR